VVNRAAVHVCPKCRASAPGKIQHAVSTMRMRWVFCRACALYGGGLLPLWDQSVAPWGHPLLQPSASGRDQLHFCSLLYAGSVREMNCLIRSHGVHLELLLLCQDCQAVHSRWCVYLRSCAAGRIQHADARLSAAGGDMFARPRQDTGLSYQNWHDAGLTQLNMCNTPGN
jgi:hypothetical protein